MDAGTLSERYKTDFGKYRRNMPGDAWARMLEQFHTPYKPGFTWNDPERCFDRALWGRNVSVLRQFLDVLIAECQELYDALIELQRQRTVYDAEGGNLDALGRIVGADRGRPLLDLNEWFHVDDARTVDSAPAWVPGAPTRVLQERTDAEFRYYVIAKAMRNHTRFASVPEVQAMVKLLIGLDASFIKTGPMTVLVVARGAGRLQKQLLGSSEDNDQYESFWVPPYPAALKVAGVLTE